MCQLVMDRLRFARRDARARGSVLLLLVQVFLFARAERSLPRSMRAAPYAARGFLGFLRLSVGRDEGISLSRSLLLAREVFMPRGPLRLMCSCVDFRMFRCTFGICGYKFLTSFSRIRGFQVLL